MHYSGGDATALLPSSDDHHKVPELHRRIQQISKRAALERRASDALIRELKDDSKKRAREITNALAGSRANMDNLQRLMKRLTSDVKYYRSQVYNLKNELELAKAHVRDAKSASDSACRRAREAEGISNRTGKALHKNIERRVNAESSYKARASDIATCKKELKALSSELERVRGERDELAAQNEDANGEQARLRAEVDSLQARAEKNESKAVTARDLVRVAKADAKRLSKSTKAVEAEREIVQQQCDELASVTEQLAAKLAQSQEQALQLHESLQRVKPPEYVDVEADEA